jgi:RHS repeat-associated protein
MNNLLSILFYRFLVGYYDANGNTTAEGSTAITYNLLNLPQTVQLSAGRTIQNTYAADGRKLKTITAENGEYTDGTKIYNGNLVFDKNGELEYILFDEGRILHDNGEFTFEYHLKDHLGSTRVAFLADSAKTVVQENAYYPFGAPIASLSFDYSAAPNRYKHEGKEYISDFDWNKYDFHARMFDPWALRSLQSDPMAEKYYGSSVYALWLDNSINMIDPAGRDAIYVAYPKYRANGIPFTGHAGVLLIDNKTGYTKYYEYGRYDQKNKGLVRTVPISNVVIGEDGRPTTESLNKVMKQLSDKSGHGGEIDGAYIISDKFEEMNDYAESKMSENSDPNRKEYSIMGNNCATFAEDVITQDKSVDKPTILIPTPRNIVDEYQEEGNARVQYNPETNITTIGTSDEKDAKVKIKY